MIALLSSVTFIVWFTIAAVVVTIISLEKQREGLASGIVSLALALLLWNYGQDVWAFVSTNVATTVYFSLGYIILGIGWSFLKWNEKVKKVFAKFKQIKTKFENEHGPVTEDNQKKFNSDLHYKFTDANGSGISIDSGYSMKKVAQKITPVGLDNKGLIMSWISYWPLSLLGTLLNNPFRRLFEFIYRQVSGAYDKISKRHQNDAFGDLNK